MMKRNKYMIFRSEELSDKQKDAQESRQIELMKRLMHLEKRKLKIINDLIPSYYEEEKRLDDAQRARDMNNV